MKNKREKRIRTLFKRIWIIAAMLGLAACSAYFLHPSSDYHIKAAGEVVSIRLRADKKQFIIGEEAGEQIQVNVSVINNNQHAIRAGEVTIKFDETIFSWVSYTKPSTSIVPDCDLMARGSTGTGKIAIGYKFNGWPGNSSNASTISLGSFIIQVKSGLLLTDGQEEQFQLIHNPAGTDRSECTVNLMEGPFTYNGGNSDFDKITFVPGAPKSPDATISTLTYNGGEIPFSQSGNTFSATVPWTTDTVDLSMFQVDNPSAKIEFSGPGISGSGTGIVNLSNASPYETTITIKATSENGENVETYYVKITRTSPQTGANLAGTNAVSVTVNSIGQTVNQNLTLYTVSGTVPYAQKDKVAITVTLNSDSNLAGLKINGATAVSGTPSAFINFSALTPYQSDTTKNTYNIPVVVTPQSGSAINYTVQIVVAKPETDKTIRTLTLTDNLGPGNNVLLSAPSTSGNVTSYSAQVSSSVTAITYLIEATNPHPFATIVIGGSDILANSYSGTLTTLPGTISFDIKAQDGTSHTYNVVITQIVVSGTTNDITSITANGTPWTIIAGMSVNDFGSVPFSTSSIVISVVHNGAYYTIKSGSTVLGTGNNPITVSLNEGLNVFTIFATSGSNADGTIYTVKITRDAAPSGVYLETLKVLNFDIDPVFSPTVFTYDIKNIPSNVNAVTINAALPVFSSFGYSISGDGNYQLSNYGDNNPNSFVISINVADNPTLAVAEYTINLYRDKLPADGNNLILYIVIGVGGLCFFLAIFALVSMITTRTKLKKLYNNPLNFAKPYNSKLSPKERAFEALNRAQDAVAKAKYEYDFYKDSKK